MDLPHTRRMLSEAIAGNLNDIGYFTEPVFGLQIPERINGVPSEILRPRNTWSDKEAYDRKASRLAGMFRENFERFSQNASKELMEAGPID
jgi:phosphoenolpyruvate carboxykinase (ATP)